MKPENLLRRNTLNRSDYLFNLSSTELSEAENEHGNQDRSPKNGMLPHPELQKGSSGLSQGALNQKPRGRAIGEFFSIKIKERLDSLSKTKPIY